ncbi:MAG: hypothetical protein ACJ75B_15870, partial [Flavisolibacter sp.]
MKRSLSLYAQILATGLICFVSLKASSQQWTYAAGFGNKTTFVDAGQAIATDALGNVYITGKFDSSINFGNGTASLTAVATGTKVDGFVAKFNSSGLCQWSRRFGGPGTDLGGLGIVTDGTLVFVTGSSAFPSTIGSFPLASVGGSSDGVVFALDALSGATAWAKAFGGTPAGDRGQALALDNSGNLYLSGSFFTRTSDPTTTASFGTTGAFPRSVQGNMAQSTSDLFVARLNAATGTFVWVSTGGAVSNSSPLTIGNDNNTGSGIAFVSAVNKLVVTGSFNNAGAVYSTSSPVPSTVSLPNAGQADICVLVLDPSTGAFTNGFGIGGNFNEEGLALTSDGTNTFLTGYFNSGTITGGFAMSNTTPGTDDIFYAEFNPVSLNFPWAKHSGSTLNDAGLGIAVNGTGKVYVSGRYQGTANFPTSSSPLSTSSAGFDDVFLVKLDAATGNALVVGTGADIAGGDFGFGVATAPSDNVWVTGSFFGGTINFTPASSSQTATSSGDDDVFLARFNDPAFIPDPTVFYSKSSGNLNDLTTWGVFPDGSGTNPTDFGSGKTFNLANRAGIYLMTADWTVGGLINNPTGSQLVINTNTLSEAGMTGSGTLTGSPSSSLVVTGSTGDAGPTGFTPGSQKLNNLKLDRTSGAFTILTPLELYNNLQVVNGVLGLGGLLTLHSDVSNTARVLPIGPTGSIAGNVQVQRYIPARRAWRILSAPVATSGQTINQSWQEGATTASVNPNPKPGFGTHITGGAVFGTVANGFDQNPGASSSLKFYNSPTDAWKDQPNTNATPAGSNAWMIFVRGDRGINLSNSSVAPTPTVLEATGPLKTGDQSFVVSPTGFTSIPNPFACPVNFATMGKTNLQNSVWLWDPKMGGANGVGAYVTVSFNGSGWDVTPASVSPESQIIQNGQGFLVHAASNAPAQLVIKESDKTTTPNMDVFRKARNSSGLRISLRNANDDQNATVLDEVFSSFSSYFSQKVDQMDVPKLSNIEENISIVSGSQLLMVERRPLLNEQDAIDLKLWNLKKQQYQMEFNP